MKHFSIGRHSFLMMLSVILLIPFYLTFINGFKTKADIINMPLGLPIDRLTLANFARSAISPSFNIFKAYGTSILITGASVFFIILLCSMMSYVIARRKNTLMTLSYLLLLSGLMVPQQVVLLPLVKVLAMLGLMFTPQGLILYNLGAYVPFTVFVYVGFIRVLSKELDESAKLDGASELTIFWRIIFPLLRPATGSVIIFLCLFIWNDFVNPLIILGSSRSYTVTTGIYLAVGQFSTNWDDVFALVTLASAPIFILFLFMQRQFISGLTEGSIKG